MKIHILRFLDPVKEEMLEMNMIEAAVAAMKGTAEIKVSSKKLVLL